MSFTMAIYLSRAVAGIAYFNKVYYSYTQQHFSFIIIYNSYDTFWSTFC